MRQWKGTAGRELSQKIIHFVFISICLVQPIIHLTITTKPFLIFLLFFLVHRQLQTFFLHPSHYNENNDCFCVAIWTSLREKKPFPVSRGKSWLSFSFITVFTTIYDLLTFVKRIRWLIASRDLVYLKFLYL